MAEKRRAALHNLGCKVNYYETEAMRGMLEDAGYEIVPFGEEADVYVVNTCSVTNIADKKSRQMLHRAKKLNPEAAVVAVGCYVQSAGTALREDPAVDLVLGNDRRRELVPVLEKFFSDRRGGGDVIDIASSREYENLRVKDLREHTRAFLKVQDGCNQFCSYCIIPYTRGRIRSRAAADVAKEAEELARGGCREMVLTGIHLASFGKDRPADGEDLAGLIETVGAIPGVDRVRLGSLEPNIVTEEFAARVAGIPAVCPHFHLSLQSGCDTVLKRMNRHYTTEEYREKVAILRKYFPGAAITTDVIAGFPGETGEEFEITRKFLEEIHFYEMHIFRYSRRAGTRADAMPFQVPEEVKAERSEILLGLADRMSAEYRENLMGKEEEILLEEPAVIEGQRWMTGYTKTYVRGAFPYQEGLKNTLKKGRFVRTLDHETLLLSDNE